MPRSFQTRLQTRTAIGPDSVFSVNRFFLIDLNVFLYIIISDAATILSTSSLAIVERPRDALCH